MLPGGASCPRTLCGRSPSPLDERRVLGVLRPRSRCEAWEVRDARIDEHVAHEECGLDVVVGLVTSCGVHRVGVGVCGDAVGVRT